MKRCVRSLSVLLLLAAAGRMSAQNQFVIDHFTGTNGTTLQAHAPNTGAAWTRILGNNLNIQTNALRATATNAGDIYTNGTTAPSANYIVGMSVTFTANSANNYINLIGRGNVTAQQGYLAQLTGNGAASQVTVWPVTAGTIGAAIINVTVSITLNVQHRFMLEMVGNQIAAYVDGTQYGPVTNNAVTVPGVVGLGLNANNITQVIADDFFASTFAVTEARMRTMTARSHDGRTLVEWTTGREVANLGFRVWRQDGGRRMLATPSVIAGSAFLTPATLTAGNRYRWLDVTATPRTRYWIESIGVDGRHEWNGPVVPLSGAFDETTSPPPLLRDLGQSVAPAARPSSRLTIGSNAVRRAVAPPDLLPKQQALAASAALKISIDADGWYRVSREELLAAGLDPATDPQRLRLYTDAREVAITVEGEAQNRVGGIRFYGTALDTPSTATRVYWLATEEGTGRRIETSTATSEGAASTSFPVTAESRDKSLFFAALSNGENESFFGPVITSSMTQVTTQTLRLAHVDRTAATAAVEIALQGATDFSTDADPTHDVAVTLKGHSLNDIRFEGRDAIVARQTVPVSWLSDGDNTIALQARNGDGDISLVSYVRITYAHTYDFDGGPLVLTAGGGTAVAVGGASSPAYALDVTATSTPIELPVTVDNGVARFTASPGVRRTIVVTTQFAKAARVEANHPSTLHATAGADLIIITHPSLLAAIEPLRQLRASQGLSVLVATVDDIYDEYGYGDKDPRAVRAFLEATRRWMTVPRYVLLVGDATFDPRNYLGFGDYDLVPTKLIATSQMKTASDSWLVDFNNDGAADVAIGRLPVRTLAEAQIEVGKVVAYENAPAGGSWTKTALLISDADSSLGFDVMNAAVRDLIPAGFTVGSIDVAASGVTAARQDLLARLDAGTLLVNFVGHGSVDIWTDAGLFGGDDAKALSNGTRLPFVVAMTCLNGYFQDVYTTSLAEMLLAAPNGGAVGVFASSSLTDANAQTLANQELVRALFVDHATIGEATIAAEQQATNPDVRRTFLLFGDPSMRLKQ